jgi:hypothetical protein
MNTKVLFQKGQYNIYYLVQPSEDRLLNFIARLFVSSGTDWIRNTLKKENFEEMRVCDHKIFVDLSDILTIYEASECDELGCCDQDINREKMEFSKSHLLALFDEWDKFYDTKPEFIKLSKIPHTNKFEWISLAMDPDIDLYIKQISARVPSNGKSWNYAEHTDDNK